MTWPSRSKQENLYLKRMWSRNLVGKRVARAGLISGPITTFSVFPVGPEASFTVGLVSIVSHRFLLLKYHVMEMLLLLFGHARILF